MPTELDLDLFEGEAWLGLTPFLLEVSLPRLPLRLVRGPETNRRTYVRGPEGERGIWFFSLDVANPLAMLGARVGFGLPAARTRNRSNRPLF